MKIPVFISYLIRDSSGSSQIPQTLFIPDEAMYMKNLQADLFMGASGASTYWYTVMFRLEAPCASAIQDLIARSEITVA